MPPFSVTPASPSPTTSTLTLAQKIWAMVLWPVSVHRKFYGSKPGEPVPILVENDATQTEHQSHTSDTAGLTEDRAEEGREPGGP